VNDRPALLLRGFAPLAVALILGILMVVLVPSIAPEKVVVHPGDPIVTTTTIATTTTVIGP
jgi:hypothetical protein